MKRFANWAIICAALGLLVAAFGKLGVLVEGPKMLSERDPFIGLSFRATFVLVVSMELVIAVYCARSRDFLLRGLCLLSFGAIVLVYRIGLYLIDYHKPCGCLGSITSVLHISESAADDIAKMMLAVILLAGASGVLVNWRAYRAKRPGSPSVEGSA